VLTVALASCCALSACGGARESVGPSSSNRDPVSTSASVAREATNAHNASHVVNPSDVPAAIQSTGAAVTFRPGPTPAPFVRAFYGTARNSHGTTVDFGFFLVDGTDAGADLTPAVEKLVPGSTPEGTVVGESYVEVTNAGAGSPKGSRRYTEEVEIADRLESRVARLAGAAFDEEGP
jgi:hypothetical protein